MTVKNKNHIDDKIMTRLNSENVTKIQVIITTFSHPIKQPQDSETDVQITITITPAVLFVRENLV
jgi:hypothetical protein